MAIGRTFKEFQKAMRSLEIGLKGFESGKFADQDLDKSAILPESSDHLQPTAIPLQSI